MRGQAAPATRISNTTIGLLCRLLGLDLRISFAIRLPFLVGPRTLYSISVGTLGVATALQFQLCKRRIGLILQEAGLLRVVLLEVTGLA